MKPEEKEAYYKNYKKEKEKGVLFFPDIIFKDAIVSLCIFLILAGLAYFVGAKLEPRANPADINYTPRPEWYFLFLFQFLKYFPGNLEVIGVLVVPGIVILGLFALPFLDRGPYRHFTNRPIVIGVVTLGMIGIITLTYLAATEVPPPAAAATGGDQVAVLYAKNCSGCHVTNIIVPPNADLHNIIAKGTHGGMPGWSGDLSSDQIDALAGFILAPQGAEVFDKQCIQCHKTPYSVLGNAIEVRKVLDQGPLYSKHADQNVSDWSKTLSNDEAAALLNFLVAPDGARIFEINCSMCHGYSLATSKTKEELTSLITLGGQHVTMPAWKQQIETSQQEALAKYVMDPQSNPDTKTLYDQKCANCHGGQIPKPISYEASLDAIVNGNSHSRAMPVWGQVLTAEQIDALTNYIVVSSQGASVPKGQKLFSQFCVACHGVLGEGGPNPARAGDLIPPISSVEYLKAHDDQTLGKVIRLGESSIGMPPFDGQLDGESIDAIVAYMRSWEKNSPAEGLVVVPSPTSTVTPTFEPSPTQTADVGEHEVVITATPSITPIPPTKEPVSYKNDVLPILKEKCEMCHSSSVTSGGWSIDTYDKVINSGENGPSVIPGDIEKSLLAQKILDKQTSGTVMPTGGKMDELLIQTILDWISSGASDN